MQSHNALKKRRKNLLINNGEIIMEYDFSGLCADQIDTLEKRLISLKKSFIKDYVVSLNVINNKNANDNRSVIKTDIDDLFNDVLNKTSIIYTECMNKVQRVINSNIK